jgi:hypothetical protein
MKKLLLFVLALNALLLAGRFWQELPAEAALGGGGVVAGSTGDVDGDGEINITDAVRLLGWLFQGGPPPVACAAQPALEERLEALEAALAALRQGIHVDSESGNVGIGTTSPGSRSGFSKFGQLELSSNTSGEAGIRWALKGSSYNEWVATARAYADSGAWGQGRLTFETAGVEDNDRHGFNIETLTLKSGRVGIGTTDPARSLDVVRNDGLSTVVGSFWSPHTEWEAESLISMETDVGRGAKVRFGNVNSRSTGPSFVVKAGTEDDQERFRITAGGNVGIGTTNPQAKLDVAGMTSTHVLQITGGSDLAEPFEVAGGESVRPGMVVAIDSAQPGRLRLAAKAYDHAVAGVISGAGGVQSGLTLRQAGTAADGSVPVALSGRVYCWVDAAFGAVEPGDLLTTSETLGHAMKATDHARAHGAVLGKAMTALREGTGLVLVLVNLQ